MSEHVRRAAIPLRGDAADHDALLELARQARFVLLGEASHGTHDFYSERARITKRLIEDAGFDAVAVEADWPDAYRVNAYVRGAGDDASAEEALVGFVGFPAWMWRNTDVRAFVEWLRRSNDALPEGRPRVGFYGIDLYSLRASVDEVVRYLDDVDPEAARRARNRYACFDHYGDEAQAYGYATEVGGAEPCENDVVEQLVELRRRAVDYAAHDGRVAEDPVLLRRAERPARQERRALLPIDVSRARVVVESPRPSHGRDARRARRAPRARAWLVAHRRLGPQLASRGRSRDGARRRG